MDRAVRRGFALGFVVVAAALALFFGFRQASAPMVSETRLQSLDVEVVQPKRAPTAAAPASSAPAPATAPAGAPSAASGPGPRSAAETAPPPPRAPSPPPGVRAPEVAALTPAAPGLPLFAPPAPPAAAPERGAFDIVRVEPSGEMVVAGRCRSGCTAQLLANGAPHDTAKADPQGQWAMTPTPLPPGDYQLGLKVRDADGRESTSAQTLTVVIPTPPSKDVVVVLNEPDAPSRILQKPEPKVAAASPRPRAPGGGVAAPAQPLAVGAIDAEEGRFFAQGTGPAGARLRFYLNNAPVAEATVGPEGRWSLRVERGVAPGAYAVRADKIDPASGKVTARAEATFSYAPRGAGAGAAPASRMPAPTSVMLARREAETALTGAATSPSADPANPVVAAIDTATVQRGDSLWRISRAIYGRGVRYTVIFQANDGQIRNPNLIYPGQVFVVPSQSAGAAAGPSPR